MFPSSHLTPIKPQGAGASPGELADMFDAFIATAGRMEASYSQLQAEVGRLRGELEERNAALTASLEENRNMRTALHEILLALPCGVIVIDPDNSIALMNAEAEGMVGTSFHDALRLSDFAPEIQAKLKSAIAQGDELEFAVKHRKETRFLSVRKSRVDVVHSQESRLTHNERTILILRDVSARKKADEAREKSRDIVSLGEMAAVLAHEIRNPLSSLELWTGLLAKQPAADDEIRYVTENLQAGVRSISATVNNVLQFHNAGVLNHVPLRLLTVLESSVAFIRPLAEQAGIKLALHSSLDKTEICGDGNALQQVVLNLALNAFRHTPRGGSFTIHARLNERAQRVLITFADTGQGIAESDLPEIFDPKATKTNGLGLGLVICRRIVEQHRGSVRVESRQGQGTTFFLELPAL